MQDIDAFKDLIVQSRAGPRFKVQIGKETLSASTIHRCLVQRQVRVRNHMASQRFQDLQSLRLKLRVLSAGVFTRFLSSNFTSYRPTVLAGVSELTTTFDLRPKTLRPPPA